MSPTTPQPAELDRWAREVLDFERTLPPVALSRERAIRARLGLSETRYHQLLMQAVDRPEALAYDPVLVRRVLRLREARRGRRLARRLGLSSSPG